MNEIEIKFHGITAIVHRVIIFFLLVLLLPIAVVAVGFLFIFEFRFPIFYSIIALLSLVPILFGLYHCIFIFFKKFKNKAALILKKEGIVDHSRFFSIGFIPWSSIKSIDSYVFGFPNFPFQKPSYIIIFLHDAKEIINKQNLIKKIFLGWRMFRYGSPVQIYALDLKYNFYELVKLIKKTWQANR